jgi:DtxR family Mn-dependent transcriptional regulator
MLEAIDERLGHPRADPHGDPIPTAGGAVPVLDGVLASSLPADAAARVVRISDRDPAVLRQLAEAGIAVGSAMVCGDLPDGSRDHVWVAPIARG